MKITQQTSTILKLQVQKYYKTLLIGLALGLGFSLTGLIMSILSSDSTTLNCNRLESAQIDCEITRKNLLSQQSRSIPVTDLTSAEVDVNEASSNDNSDTYEIILITKNSRIPLTNTYSSGWGFDHYKQNQLINSFIQASAPNSLTVKHDMRWGLIIGIIFMLVSPILAIHVLFSKRITSCIFNKELNQLLITKRNLLKSEQKELILEQVKEVIAIKHINYGCIIKIFMPKNEDIELRPFSFNKNKLEETYDKYGDIAQSINQFIER
ncbi:MAG: hypothetical protein WBA13_19880 [Microcoleaceae cyanobacterium]